MSYGLTDLRYQEVEQELTTMEGYLVELAQEIRDNTRPGFGYNHTWLQVDGAISYARSLRAALQRERVGRS